jgi:hypothetical protein
MAIIEFENTETEKAFNDASLNDRKEQQRLKRGLFLLKNGLWSPNW